MKMNIMNGVTFKTDSKLEFKKQSRRKIRKNLINQIQSNKIW